MFSGVIPGWTGTHVRLLIIAHSQIRCSTFFLCSVIKGITSKHAICHDIHFAVIGIDI